MILLASYSRVDQTVHLIEVIILFAVVLFLTYYTTRFIAGFQKGKLSAGNFSVIDSMRLSQNKVIQIIRIGDRFFALAIGKDEVTVICELKEDEITDPATFMGEMKPMGLLDRFKKHNESAGFDKALNEAMEADKDEE